MIPILSSKTMRSPITLITLIFSLLCNYNNDNKNPDNNLFPNTNTISNPNSIINTNIEKNMQNEPPITSFTISQKTPLVTTLDTNKSSNNQKIVSYNWDFNNNETKSNKLIEHTYTTTGYYEITLIITNTETTKNHTKQTTQLITTIKNNSAKLTIKNIPTNDTLLPHDPKTNKTLITIEKTIPTTEFKTIVTQITINITIEHKVRTNLYKNRFSLELAIPTKLTAQHIDITLMRLKTKTTITTTNNIVTKNIILMNKQSNTITQKFSKNTNKNLNNYVHNFKNQTKNITIHTTNDS